jgi:hypothetical protein
VTKFARAQREDVVNVRRSQGKRPFEEATRKCGRLSRSSSIRSRVATQKSPLRWTCKSTHALSAELFSAHGDGFVSVGVDRDTPVLAVKSIEAWWKQVGAQGYPTAHELFITADAGGSNSYRSHVWKQQLQRLADTLNLAIHVSHFPPGTSKWNKVEHRLFSFISVNWRGRPLRSYETVINLISNATRDVSETEEVEGLGFSEPTTCTAFFRKEPRGKVPTQAPHLTEEETRQAGAPEGRTGATASRARSRNSMPT